VLWLVLCDISLISVLRNVLLCVILQVASIYTAHCVSTEQRCLLASRVLPLASEEQCAVSSEEQTAAFRHGGFRLAVRVTSLHA
jgi:hypothetical protein